MADEKNSIDIIDRKEGPIHLSTLGADVSFIEIVGEDRKKKERALVRKVDIRMMPLMMLLCKSWQAVRTSRVAR
jgi:hypothetical protein